MKKLSRQRDKWFALIEEQEKSGLSVSIFCKERNLKLAQMHAYRHQLKKRKSMASENNQEKLVPIQITSQHDILTPSGDIRLIFANGIHCILPARIQAAQMKSLVEVLIIC